MNTEWIAPSILAADFSRLGEEVSRVTEAGAELIHFDVMDNHFVPNLTVGPTVCASLRRFIDSNGLKVEIDAHLMIDPVEALIPRFADAGAAIISFHPEASRDVHASIAAIRQAGCKPGLVFSPDVPLDGLASCLESIDLVLVMSVHPGFGGQAFIESSYARLAAARRMLDAAGSQARLEVDGGVTLDNVAQIAAAGADTFVAGSTIYGSKDYASTIGTMRERIRAARQVC